MYRMSLCTRNRWGTGSSSSCGGSSSKTDESKKMDDKLKQMMAERAKQDTRWLPNQTDANKPSK